MWAKVVKFFEADWPYIHFGLCMAMGVNIIMVGYDIANTMEDYVFIYILTACSIVYAAQLIIFIGIPRCFMDMFPRYVGEINIVLVSVWVVWMSGFL